MEFISRCTHIWSIDFKLGIDEDLRHQKTPTIKGKSEKNWTSKLKFCTLQKMQTWTKQLQNIPDKKKKEKNLNLESRIYKEFLQLINKTDDTIF